MGCSHDRQSLMGHISFGKNILTKYLTKSNEAKFIQLKIVVRMSSLLLEPQYNITIQK
jgi:hypothetical protein